jgi:hypothetical protein
MSEWRPIETAPMDGTEVLLYFPAGKFVPEANDFDGEIVSTMAVMSANARGYFSGYYEGVGPNGEPTHWMPLPDPPSSAPT